MGACERHGRLHELLPQRRPAPLLGPIIGITICHYFFICRTELNLRSLYVPEDESKYTNLKKFNMPTYVLCFAAAAALVVLSFVLPSAWDAGHLHAGLHGTSSR